jgi:hypothetical protein
MGSNILGKKKKLEEVENLVFTRVWCQTFLWCEGVFHTAKRGNHLSYLIYAFSSSRFPFFSLDFLSFSAATKASEAQQQ